MTYANVISTICLVLVLGGGVAYSATQLRKNSVGTKQLKNGAVTQRKISKSAQKALRGATGPAGASGVGPAFSAIRDDRFAITSLDIADPMPLVTLSGLPAGSYAITARTFLHEHRHRGFCEMQTARPRDRGGPGNR